MKTDSIVFNQGIYETAKHYSSREINRLKTNFSKLNSMPELDIECCPEKTINWF